MRESAQTIFGFYLVSQMVMKDPEMHLKSAFTSETQVPVRKAITAALLADGATIRGCLPACTARIRDPH